MATAVFFRGEVGPIVLDNVQCGGVESRLIDCEADRNRDCEPIVDAGVICYGAIGKNYSTKIAPALMVP